MSEELTIKINRLRQESRQAKLAIWNRIQIEAPDLAVFMREAKTKFNAEVEEIKLGGKTVWKR